MAAVVNDGDAYRPLIVPGFCACSAKDLTDFGLAQYGFGFHGALQWALLVRLNQGLFDQFDPVPDRGATGAVEVDLAADVGGDDKLRLAAFQSIEPVVAQLAR